MLLSDGFHKSSKLRGDIDNLQSDIELLQPTGWIVSGQDLFSAVSTPRREKIPFNSILGTSSVPCCADFITPPLCLAQRALRSTWHPCCVLFFVRVLSLSKVGLELYSEAVINVEMISGGAGLNTP